jgi:hypothetical protein
MVRQHAVEQGGLLVIESGVGVSPGPLGVVRLLGFLRIDVRHTFLLEPRLGDAERTFYRVPPRVKRGPLPGFFHRAAGVD